MARHEFYQTRIYRIWSAMKGRCLNKNNTGYKYYGGRGVTICEEWIKFNQFKDWAFKNGYEDHLEIDREENDGNYEPNNCRWTSRSTQNANRRKKQGCASQFIGVHWNKILNKWPSQIEYLGEKINIGCYDNESEAARERDIYIINNNLPHKLNFKWFNVGGGVSSVA